MRRIRKIPPQFPLHLHIDKGKAAFSVKATKDGKFAITQYQQAPIKLVSGEPEFKKLAGILHELADLSVSKLRTLGLHEEKPPAALSSDLDLV